jgi:oligopeptide transport system substrate-binding protein
MKRFIISGLFAFLIIFLFFFPSCISTQEDEQEYIDDTSPPPSLNDEEEEPEDEDKTIEFVFALSYGSVNLDPVHAYTAMEAQFFTAMYEGLVTYDPVTLVPAAGMAREWEISEDKKTYRFYLQEESYFSNGDPVTARDVRDSWFRLLEPDAKAEFSTFFDVIKGAKEYRQGIIKDREKVGIYVISDKIIDVELEAPAAHFLKLLCHMSFVIIHPGYYEVDNWSSLNSVISNGPFYIHEKKANEIVFLKNKLYWDAENVEIERLIFRFYDDLVKVSHDFNAGNIDWAVNWDSSELDDTSKIVFNPMFATGYFFFKCSSEPWNDDRIRTALALLIPWENIRNQDVFYPTDQLVPKLDANYPIVESISDSDIRKAYKLLEEAGYPKGKGLPPIVIRITPGGDIERIAYLMKEAWEDSLETDVVLDFQDYSVYYSALKDDDYVIGQMTWIGDFADPIAFLQMWESNSNLNDAEYHNPEYDKLIREASADLSKERYNIFAQAETILLTTAVVLPISHRPTVNLINLDYIDGWYPNAIDMHPFKYIRFKTGLLFPNIIKYTP